MNLSGAFKKYLQDVSYTAKAAGKFVRGEFVEGAATTETMKMTVIPMTPKTLRYMPEGVYDINDIGCYHEGQAVLNRFDKITVNGNRYFVRDIHDRRHGTYTKYFCKVDNEEQGNL